MKIEGLFILWRLSPISKLNSNKVENIIPNISSWIQNL